MKKVIVSILVLAACLSLLTGCGKKTAGIDLTEYMNALYSGTEVTGKARGDFDFIGFEEAVRDGVKSDEFNLKQLVRFETSMVITVSPNKNLKNGDKVTITASYDKELAKNAGIRIKENSKTFIVEGLGSAH